MLQHRTKICGAPGCPQLSAEAAGKSFRRVNGIPVCRNCYQRAWEYAKDRGLKLSEIQLTRLPHPQLPPPAPAATCARAGCDVSFAEGERGEVGRRFIGGKTVCNPCYQIAWSKAKENKISLSRSLATLPPKGTYRRPSRVAIVGCDMPWCHNTVESKWANRVSRSLNAYACGKCRSYLKNVAARFKHLGKKWQHWGVEAIKGRLFGPDAKEQCSMPWCTRILHHGKKTSNGYGPRGEIVCATDRMYLYQYARRNNISFRRAFEVAPPPLRRGNLRQ